MTEAVTPPADDGSISQSPEKPLTSGEDMYLVRKAGAYYRPNAAGYTYSIAEAGRYTLEEAIRHSYPNGPDGPRDGITFMLAPPVEALEDHFPSGLRAEYPRTACGVPVPDTGIKVDCRCGWSTDAADEQEARHLWANHARAALSGAAE